MMNISTDFVDRFEQAKEAFKASICQQVDLWFAPLLSELKSAKALGKLVPPPVSQGHLEQNGLSTGSKERDRQPVASVTPPTTNNRQSDHQAAGPSTSRVATNASNSSTDFGRFFAGAPPPTLAPVWRPTAAPHHHPQQTSSQRASPPPSRLKTIHLKTSSPANNNSNSNQQHQPQIKEEYLDETFNDDHETSSDCSCGDCTDRLEALDACSSSLDEPQIHQPAGPRPAKKPKTTSETTSNHSDADSQPPDFSVLATQILNRCRNTGAGTQPPSGHSSYKPYQCPVTSCPKAFRKKCELAVHLWSHRGVKPFKCLWSGCDGAFSQRGNAIMHIRKAHFNLPPLLKEQVEQGIIDDRDPAEYLEVIPELVNELASLERGNRDGGGGGPGPS